MKREMDAFWKWLPGALIALAVGLFVGVVLGIVYAVSRLIALVLFVVFIAWLFERTN